jgi:hypothetical protein
MSFGISGGNIQNKKSALEAHQSSANKMADRLAQNGFTP